MGGCLQRFVRRSSHESRQPEVHPLENVDPNQSIIKLQFVIGSVLRASPHYHSSIFTPQHKFRNRNNAAYARTNVRRAEFVMLPI